MKSVLAVWALAALGGCASIAGEKTQPVTVPTAPRTAAHANSSWITDDGGCKHLNPYPKPNATETVTWTGSCTDGFADGQGTEQWFLDGAPNGRFTGTLKHGTYTGNGVYALASASTYRGGFVDGKHSGHGILQLANGDRLEGEFADGSLAGATTVQQADGTRYEAHFNPVMAHESAAARCPQMGRPVLPPVNWVGTAKFRAVATFHDGRVTAVKATALTSLGNSAAEQSLANAVETAIRHTYQCSGDQIVQQEFVFRLARPIPIWITDDKGCKHSARRSPLRPNEALTWTASCSGGFADGEGVEEWLRDGKPVGRFTGAMKGGRYSTAHGAYWWASGSTYEGGFSDGSPNGHGVFRWANGNSYEGDVVAGELTGYGTFSWANGSTYEGDFIDNQKTGYGFFQWAGGNSYEGDVVAGDLTGRGTFRWANGDIYEGDFVNNEKTGHGVFRWADGGSYEGGVVDGERSGQGVWKIADGDRVEGEFANDSPVGTTVVQQADGTRYQAQHKQGAQPVSAKDSESLCSQMGKPVLPPVNWEGTANFTAIATIHDGRVTTVRVNASPSLDDDNAEQTLAHAIESTIRQTYQCRGDHVIQQGFVFKIAPTDPTPITDNMGCIHLSQHPALKPNETMTWTGACSNGDADGEGVEEWLQDGKPLERFTGDIKRGVYANGHGTYWWANVGTYEGDFVGGEKTGHGVLHMLNGDSYEGDFIDSRMTGQGIYRWANGAIYTGAHRNAHFTGRGVLVTPDGARVEGQFLNGALSLGVVLRPDGTRLEGEFVAGKQTGYGTTRNRDGTVYEGSFVNSLPNGRGTVRYFDGSGYQGNFANGMPNGHGVRKEGNGDRLEGEFVNGDLRGPVTVVQADGTRYQAHYDQESKSPSWNDDDSHCTQMGKPELPPVDWSGKVSFRAIATFHDGRATVVKATALQHIDNALVESTLAHSVEDTVRQTYRCPGDGVIEQNFDFTVDP